MSHSEIAAALQDIFAGIERLTKTFPHRAFTIDGRLVGDVGEVIGAMEYDLELDQVSRPIHDAMTRDGRNVQIKATFKQHLTMRSVPDLYLGLQLSPDGTFTEVYNGPGARIQERYAHRKGIGKDLLSFPVTELRKLAANVPAHLRIPRREACGLGAADPGPSYKGT
ncbi:MAG: hypothetical protein IPK85_05605 [Gemmatimonadetes bacterium]|nr:hypothetical protein [Gemmatimonadota bacterium]